MLDIPQTLEPIDTHDAVLTTEKSLSSNKPLSADFFAGSGLVTQALKPYFTTAWANDICSKKEAVFRANHPSKVFHLDDIAKVSGENIPSHTLSWASFPCQDLSLAGNMTGIQSSRSGMVWQWLRILDEMPTKPKVVVAENVVGLVSGKEGANYIALHSALNSRGYSVGAVLLDASLWVPQSRPRIFVIGVSNSINFSHFTTNGPTWAHPKSIRTVAQKVDNWVWWKLPEPKG